MRALSATELLAVWERGASQTLPQRALGLLAAASPDSAPDSLARLSIGQRDAHLLTLRAWMFGQQLAGLAKCPQCAEGVEVTFDTAEILPLHNSDTAKEFSVEIEDYKVQFRLPVSSDLASLVDLTDVTTARGRLLDCCLLTAQCKGEQLPVGELPAHV